MLRIECSASFLPTTNRSRIDLSAADRLPLRRYPARLNCLLLGLGLLGIGTHLLTLWVGMHLLALAFPSAQAMATVAAMTGNFVLNNLFTYRDRRLRGGQLLWGLISFYAVCGAGAAANVGIASYVLGLHETWWLAGLAGAAVSAVWNYAASSVFTWSRYRAAPLATAPVTRFQEVRRGRT